MKRLIAAIQNVLSVPVYNGMRKTQGLPEIHNAAMRHAFIYGGDAESLMILRIYALYLDNNGCYPDSADSEDKLWV